MKKILNKIIQDWKDNPIGCVMTIFGFIMVIAAIIDSLRKHG